MLAQCFFLCLFIHILYMFSLTSDCMLLWIFFLQDHSQAPGKHLVDGIINNLSGLFKPKAEVGYSHYMPTSDWEPVDILKHGTTFSILKRRALPPSHLALVPSCSLLELQRLFWETQTSNHTTNNKSCSGESGRVSKYILCKAELTRAPDFSL